MKIKILKYKLWKGDDVIVRSHNKKKGVWIENPKFAWHLKASDGDTLIQGAVLYRILEEKEIE